MKPALHSLGLTAATLATAVSLVSGCSHMPNRVATAMAGGWSAVTFSTPSEQRAVILDYGTKENLTKLASAGVDIWSVDRKAHRAKVQIDKAQSEIAKTLGVSVTPMTTRDAGLTVDKGYRSYEQIAARLQELNQQAPDFTQLVNIGNSWETTQGKAKRNLLALRVGKGTGKPVVMFIGCTHAREIVTPEMVLMEAEKLVTQYGKDAAVTAAVENREIWLVPMVNPDGHAHALKGESWRKNTNNVTGGHSNAGVDLNRNYGSFWGVVGDSSNPDSDVFRGQKAFSEPETCAVRDFVTAHVPTIFMTFHSFSNSVMWPWDHTNDAPPDARLAKLGAQLGKLSGYDAYQGCDMYLNGGDDEEWVFDNLKSLAYTVEIGTWSDGFMPPFKKVPQFFNENGAMMDYALKVADNPAAVSGPATRLTAARGALQVDAPTNAARAEYFVGKPGQPGTGKAIKLTGGHVAILPEDGPQRLMFVHTMGANGQWGPFEAAWTR